MTPKLLSESKELVARFVARGKISVSTPDGEDAFKKIAVEKVRQWRAKNVAAGLTMRGTPRKNK